MTFFEDLTSKLEDIGHVVYQKGQETAEITKLKVRIAELKCANDKLYKKIGFRYVNNPGITIDSDYVEYMEAHTQAVRLNLREIADLNRKIRSIKGLILCECGAEVPVDTAFCPSCGKQLKTKLSIDLINDDEELPF